MSAAKRQTADKLRRTKAPAEKVLDPLLKQWFPNENARPPLDFTFSSSPARLITDYTSNKNYGKQTIEPINAVCIDENHSKPVDRHRDKQRESRPIAREIKLRRTPNEIRFGRIFGNSKLFKVESGFFFNRRKIDETTKVKSTSWTAPRTSVRIADSPRTAGRRDHRRRKFDERGGVTTLTAVGLGVYGSPEGDPFSFNKSVKKKTPNSCAKRASAAGHRPYSYIVPRVPRFSRRSRSNAKHRDDIA